MPLFLKGKKMQNMYILISRDVQSNFTIVFAVYCHNQ